MVSVTRKCYPIGVHIILIGYRSIGIYLLFTSSADIPPKKEFEIPAAEKLALLSNGSVYFERRRLFASQS